MTTKSHKPKMTVTIITPEMWHETKNLYGGMITDTAYFINRPVYINRPPASCPVEKDLHTNNRHITHQKNSKKNDNTKTN